MKTQKRAIKEPFTVWAGFNSRDEAEKAGIIPAKPL